MATPEQENDIRKKLKAVLDGLAGLKPADLVRTELGSDLNFESGVKFFSRTLRLLHALNEADLTDVSYQKLTQLHSVAVQQEAFFRQIQEFSIQKYPNNPIGQRDSFITQVRDSYDNLFEHAAPVVAFTVRKGTDFARLEEEGKQILERIQAITKEHSAAMASARETADQIVAEVRKVAQDVGISQHMIYFKDAADTEEKSAKKWLKATIAMAGVTAAVGIALIFIYFTSVKTFEPAQNLQLAISKLVIFSLFFTATLWAGRTYRTHSHNATVNRHRQNALATFEAFAKAASDTQTKNAVLIQATQCIFSPQPTGYIAGESEAGGGIGHVLEIVRDLGKTK